LQPTAILASILFSLTHGVQEAIDKEIIWAHVSRRMKIEFHDERLALIRTDRAHELGLPFGVIKSCREKLLLIEAAPDERTLRNWKSLNYKKLEGVKDDRRQIRINQQYRIVFTITNSTLPPVVTILEIGDTH
jgi:proteic killer suppression protein